MSIQQDMLLAFVDCIERSGAQLAKNRYVVELMPSAGSALVISDAHQMLPAAGGNGTQNVQQPELQNGNKSGGGGELVTECEVVLGFSGVKQKKNKVQSGKDDVLKAENEEIEEYSAQNSQQPPPRSNHFPNPQIVKNQQDVMHASGQSQGPSIQLSAHDDFPTQGQLGPLIATTFHDC
eukprot:TRINITY_DN2783_c0_g1_i2.p3 TRINITY_DN2783_c0_g1~~TRINITY_DN2783_c0_g1_i2.p3  ORF type:complete len:179 (-),score=35.01 TRINITY_DN2783_c0_g1_i2:360-896(-)